MPAADQANASQADPPGLTFSVSVSALQHLIIEVLRRPVEFTEFSPSLLEQTGSSSADLLELAEAHFTHFINLGARITPRSKPISQIREAVASLERRERRYTDLLFYNARSR